MLKQSLDYTGDPYPGETNQIAVDATPEHDWNPAEDYKWFYGNGQFHISEDHDHEELAGHSGVKPNHTGPMAVGSVHVDMGKATFDVQSNIGAQAIARVLKDYCKQVGWAWGGLVDHEGEPVGAGSEFAPVKSYYYNEVGQNETRIAHKSDSSMPFAVHVEGDMAEVHGPITAGLIEWAEDNGYKLAGNDNVMKRIEDMEQDNNYTPEWNNPDEHFMFKDAPDERQPGGVFKCQGCGRIFHNWKVYMQHRNDEEPPGDYGPDGTKDTQWLDMDAPIPAHWHDQPTFTEARTSNSPSGARLAYERKATLPNGWHTCGRCGNTYVGGGPCPECGAPYNTPPPPSLSQPPVNAPVIPHTPKEKPIPQVIPTPPGQKDPVYGWRRPVLYWPEADLVGLGNHGDYHYDVREGMRKHLEKHGEGRGRFLPSGRAVHGWLSVPHDPNIGMGFDSEPRAQGLRIRGVMDDYQSLEDADVDRLQKALIPHVPEAANLIDDKDQYGEFDNYWTGATQAPEGKDMIAAPIPFIYDIQEDQIVVGQPGSRQSDIPGKFTPGGIVEGTYEPGGKVEIRSMTNTPYTVRHMLELWYYQHPHMEITNVHLVDDADKRTKLAAMDNWQQGDCDTYACALLDQFPHMRLGVAGYKDDEGWIPQHYFAHDDTHAYDSLGKHPLPYRGIEGQFDHVELNQKPEDWGLPENGGDMAAAREHAHQLHRVAGTDIGGYITSLVGADPVAWRSSRALRAAGGKVYVVGGAVRDALRGKEPKDIDMMVTGLPEEEIRRALGHLPGKVDLTGKDFGVFRYKEGGNEVEIALPRRERSLEMGSNGRPLPGEADHTMTPEEDLYRRDFTVNAMAVDLDTGHLIDPFGGAKDVKEGRLRTLNTKSLSDDPLRTVRALVAASKHGFMPDAETREQMAENAHLVAHLPEDRIREELDKLFAADNPGAALRLAHQTGLLKVLLPKVDRAIGWSQDNPHHELELGEHLLNVMERVKERSPHDIDLILAGLLHDTGKYDSRWDECKHCERPDTGDPRDQYEPVVIPQVGQPCPTCGNKGSGHYYKHIDKDGNEWGQQHEDVGATEAEEWMRKMRYSEARIARVKHLIQHHMFPGFDNAKGARRFLNRVGDEHADDLLNLRWADQGGKSEYPTDASLSVDNQQQLVNQARQEQAPTQLSQLAVNGRDLIAAGMKPGPEMGNTLERLVQEVVENPNLNTKDALLGLVRGWGLVS